MNNRSISVYSALAVLLWTLGAILIVVDMVSNWETGELGLLAAGGGGVLSIRAYFCAFERRERNAFLLGRDYGEHTAEVRSLR